MLPRVSWQARVVGGRLSLAQQKSKDAVPFVHGDTIGKSALAVQDAEKQSHLTGKRRQLYELQAAAGTNLKERECPLQHSFIDGVYVRTIFIPAGTVIVGKIHKHSHANILSKGEVIVFTEEGDMEHLKGPITMVSPAGCKRAVRALTDTTWTTIHRTDETDLDKIEDWVIAKSYEDYEQFKLEGKDHMKKLEVSK
jgi:hypothetical protein